MWKGDLLGPRTRSRCATKTTEIYVAPNLGQILLVTHEKHSLFSYRCYRKEKNTDEFPPEGIHVCCPPQGIHVCCPHPVCCRCYRKGCFFHHRGLKCVGEQHHFFGWFSKRYVGVSLPGTLRQFLLPHENLTHRQLRLPVCYRYRYRISLENNRDVWCVVWPYQPFYCIIYRSIILYTW